MWALSALAVADLAVVWTVLDLLSGDVSAILVAALVSAAAVVYLPFRFRQ